MKIGRFTLRQEHLVVVGMLSLFFLGLILFGQDPQGLGSDPDGAKQGSSYYSTRTGGKALYTLLRRLGIPAVRHGKKIEDLPERASLLMLLAHPMSFEEEELEKLKEWVEEGGTVVWCPRQGLTRIPVWSLPEAFGIDVESEHGTPDGPVEATLKPVAEEGREGYSLSLATGLRLAARDAEASVKPLAEDDAGWLAAVSRVSQGRFIALADPALVSNATMDKGDNAEFIVHLVIHASQGEPVYFDEFHHGFQTSNTAFGILWDSPAGLGAAVLLAALFCGVFVRGRRLGPPVDLHEERRRKPTEYMDACARLCRGLKAGPQALSMVLGEFRSYLKREHGATTREAMARLDQRAGLPRDSVSGVLENARRLALTPQAEDRVLVECARRLEEVRRAIVNKDKARRKP